MSFPLEKYKFVVLSDKVIAISSYAGKTVKGVAKCAPGDTFDVEKGKQLAAARCNMKVAEKRLKRANAKLEMADQILVEADAFYQKMADYADDAFSQLEDALYELDELETSM